MRAGRGASARVLLATSVAPAQPSGRHLTSYIKRATAKKPKPAAAKDSDSSVSSPERWIAAGDARTIAGRKPR